MQTHLLACNIVSYKVLLISPYMHILTHRVQRFKQNDSRSIKPRSLLRPSLGVQPLSSSPKKDDDYYLVPL